MARNKEFDPAEKLEKARNLFWQKGYNATSMQDLVDAMGLNRGSIYDTYGDKHSLYIECLKSYVNAGACSYNTLINESKSPMAAIEGMIMATVESAISNNKSCMAVKSTFEMAACDEQVKDLTKNNCVQNAAMFEGLIKKAQKEGEIKASIDAALLANFIVSSFSGFSQNYALFGNAKQVRKMAGLLIESMRA